MSGGSSKRSIKLVTGGSKQEGIKGGPDVSLLAQTPTPVTANNALLANQLAQGGYGQPASILASLNQIYSPQDPAEQWGWFYDVANKLDTKDKK